MEFLVSSLVWIHVILGSIAVMAGAVAFAMKKGSQRHIKSGQVFAITMVVSSIVGAVLGLMKFEQLYITFHGGVLGVTLILGSILTLRSGKPGLHGWALVVAAVNLLNFLALLTAGGYALGLPEGKLASFNAEDYFFLSAMAGVALFGDVMMMLPKKLAYKSRIARHLWRMSLGFFIAAGSAFTGPGMKAFPLALQESGALMLPEFIIFVLMLFWLARTFMAKPKRASEQTT